AFGIPLEDHYTNVVGWLLQNRVGRDRIVKMCCEFPGKFMERYTGARFGRIEPGYVGSFTVVEEMDVGNLIDGCFTDNLQTKCGWSPFKGMVLGEGSVSFARQTIVRGKSLNYTDY
ncbi:hypothetical protein KY359_00680, partial [Candidatus Woesearchaeota archaeon]|nr:hypothetical protein [Candidatus Woesearchaeota archaeon]